MRYIVTLFWAVVLGQVVGYIGAALTSGTYDFTLTTIISFIAGVIILLIGAVAPRKETLPIRKNSQELEISQALFYFLLLTTIIICCEELYES